MWPLLARWRRESPVVHLGDGQVYVARMTDCWTVLRDHWRGLFDGAAVLDEALADSLQIWIEDAPSAWSRIQAVVDQVNTNVRGIHYPDRFWTYQPRPAVRTWDTAYGHPLDRAVLTAALLRGAGYEVTPIFVGRGNRFPGEGVPRLNELGDLHLSIKGDPAGLYDPDGGTLSGQAPLIGLPLWRTDQFFELGSITKIRSLGHYIGVIAFEKSAGFLADHGYIDLDTLVMPF